MIVDLSPELEQLVQNKVQSGHYLSPSEVVREALRLLEQKDEQHILQLQELRNHIDKGLSQADSHDFVDGQTFMQSLIDELDSREIAGNAG